MVRGVTLKNRISGPWSSFESYLLNTDNIHVGWVKWVNQKSFRLVKNPITYNLESPFLYLAYPEIASSIDEGDLIRVTAGKAHLNVDFKGKNIYGSFKEKFFIVEQFEKMQLSDLPKPYLYGSDFRDEFPTNKHERVKEFLHRITQSWYNSEDNELFQKEVAYNLLACQRNFYGVGGIGSESFIPSGKKRERNFLVSSTKKLLPNEFRRNNNRYQFKFLLNENDISMAQNKFVNSSVNEFSYNDLSKLEQIESEDIQIQIPLILPGDVSYKSQEFFDPDVMDYHMYALMLKPTIKQNDIKRFTDLAQKTSQYIGKEYTSETLLIDSFSLLKVAAAMCRLFLVEDLEEDMIPNVKDELFSMFKEYADNYKEFIVRGNVNRWSSLSNESRMVYGELLSLDKSHKEIGKEWISLDEFNTKFDAFTLDRALNELNNYGYIINRYNFAELRIVDYSL